MLEISVITLVSSVIKDSGFMGLFRGLSSTILRDVPFTFFFFGSYDAWSYLLSLSRHPIFCSSASLASSNNRIESTPQNTDTSSTQQRIKLNAFGIYLAGGAAGGIAWSIAFPMDSIKSRVQISSSSLSFVQMARHIYAGHGIRGFYYGWSSAVIRAFPANAGLLLGYETVMGLFHDNEL
jgi:hypothetical protein